MKGHRGPTPRVGHHYKREVTDPIGNPTIRKRQEGGGGTSKRISVHTNIKLTTQHTQHNATQYTTPNMRTVANKRIGY